MKKLIPFFALCIAANLSLKAQYLDRGQLPEPVKSAFAGAYSTVNEEAWEKEGKKYKAVFKVDTVSHELTYDNTGKLLIHQYTSPVSSLPEAVVKSGSKVYPDVSLIAADRVEDGSKVSYILSYRNGNTPLRVQVTEKGLIMRTFED